MSWTGDRRNCLSPPPGGSGPPLPGGSEPLLGMALRTHWFVQPPRWPWLQTPGRQRVILLGLSLFPDSGRPVSCGHFLPVWKNRRCTGQTSPFQLSSLSATSAPCLFTVTLPLRCCLFLSEMNHRPLSSA